MPPVEEDKEQVCQIDAILGEQYQLQQLQEDLTEELGEVLDELWDASESCAVYGSWRKKKKKSSICRLKRTVIVEIT